MLKTFNATVSVLKILFPRVIIFAPFFSKAFISSLSIPPSGPITTAILIFSLFAPLFL